MVTAFDAPIVAVTAYLDHARVTRRGRVRLGGDNRFVLGGLPASLRRDSVRVGGTGGTDTAAIAGVDVAEEPRAGEADGTLRALREKERAARRRFDEAEDAVSIAESRTHLLESLAVRAGTTFARGLADGSAEPSRVAEVGDALAGQLRDVLATRREVAERRAVLADELAAATRAVELHRSPGTPDRVAVTVELMPATETAGETEALLEVSYVVTGAHWEAAYDVRLTDDALALTWHGMVSQQTGEDWPECELALSTARPASSMAVPELRPWYLDREKPVMVANSRRAGVFAREQSAGGGAPGGATELAALTSAVEHGGTAATYRPARPVAVPADGAAHRTTIAELRFDARLDHVTAPVRDEQAYLRATAANTSEHTLPSGKAAVFHGTEFTGVTRLDPWAPGEDVELALGIDDRIRVERKLVRRTAGRGSLSGMRRREASYRIAVTNHSFRPARVTVLDQIPVSRDGGITVRDVRTEPEPAEHTDLGELTWRLDLEPGARGEITFGFRVDVSKGAELSGWRE